MHILFDYKRLVLLFLRIFFILILIGVVFPHLVNKLIGILKLNGNANMPKGNSTLVISFNYFKSIFLYYLDKIINFYFNI